MPKYRVNRDQGYPVDVRKHAHGEVFESDDPREEKAVDQGYLTFVYDEPEPSGEPIEEN